MTYIPSFPAFVRRILAGVVHQIRWLFDRSYQEARIAEVAAADLARREAAAFAESEARMARPGKVFVYPSDSAEKQRAKRTYNRELDAARARYQAAIDSPDEGREDA